MLRLSKRLEMIAEEVPAGSRLADIGSDHALLPSYLAEQGTIASGVAGEVNPGPLEAARKQVEAAGLQHIIDVRCGDGLDVIAPGEADVITIAGMGGALISSILEAGKAKLIHVRRLILQPNVGESLVRRWLMEHDWVLNGERILKEDGKIYEIITALPAGQSKWTNDQLYQPLRLPGGFVADQELLLQMGPYLIREASSVWIQKWWYELDKLDKICAAMSLSGQEASRQKEAEFRQEMRRIQEVLACTQKAKL